MVILSSFLYVLFNNLLLPLCPFTNLLISSSLCTVQQPPALSFKYSLPLLVFTHRRCCVF